MKQKLGFNVKESRGMVSYSQVYNGAIVFAVAQVSEGDTFNLELGKAIAYAKCEYFIRCLELQKARRVKETIGAMVKNDEGGTSRLWSKHMATASDYANTIGRYRKNQKHILELVKSGTITGATYKDILQQAHDLVCGVAPHKANKE